MSLSDYTEKQRDLFKKCLKVLGGKSYEYDVADFITRMVKESSYSRRTFVKKAIKKFSNDEELPIVIEKNNIYRRDLEGGD